MSIITNISATVRMSKQTPTNEWITIELGAEAQSVADDGPWLEQQHELYQNLKRQLANLFQAKTPPAAQASVHDHTELPAAETRHNKTTGEVQHRCPTHKISHDSRHGGLFCPGKNDNGDHCTWTHHGPARTEARRG